MERKHVDSNYSTDLKKSKLNKIKKKSKKKKKKKSKISRSKSDSDSSCTSSTSSDSYKKAKLKKRKKKEKKIKEKIFKKNEIKEKKRKTTEEKIFGPEVPNFLIQESKVRAPMTKEEWEKSQSSIRKVYDSETNRYRLIKGDGEILEEIVSRERHIAINKQATLGDGAFFQSEIKKKKISISN
jgi:hypothetical protein